MLRLPCRKPGLWLVKPHAILHPFIYGSCSLIVLQLPTPGVSYTKPSVNALHSTQLFVEHIADALVQASSSELVELKPQGVKWA